VMEASGPEPPEGTAEQPSQEELRARLEEQLRNLRVQDLIVESVVSVLNLTARRIAKEDERDLEQGRIGIEAVRAWVGLLPEEAANQIRQALSELQLLYAQAAEGGQPGGDPSAPGGGVEEVPGGGAGERAQDAPGGGSEQPMPQPGRPTRPGEPPPRLWTPGSS
jgi:hypothetical protein